MDRTPNIIKNAIYRVAAIDLRHLNFGREYAGAIVKATSYIDDRREVSVVLDDLGRGDFSGLKVPDTYRLEIAGEVIDPFQVTTEYLCSLEHVLDFNSDKKMNARQYGANLMDAWVARAQATETIEDACGRHFTPVVERDDVRFGRTRHVTTWPDASLPPVKRHHHHKQAMKLSDSIFAVRPHTEQLTYIAGLTHAPLNVRRACVILASSYLTPSRIPDRALSEATEDGIVRFSIEGITGATGIPAVDAVIDRYKRSRVMVS